MRALASIALLLAGCGYTFDGEAPDVQLVGGPPPLSPLRVRMGRTERLQVVRGADGADWVALYQVNGLDLVRSDPAGSARVACLEPPAAVEQLAASRIEITRRAFYLIQAGADPSAAAALTIRSAGDPVGQLFALPSANGLLIASDDGDAFAYWALGAPTFLLARRDGSSSRTLAVPRGSQGALVRAFFNRAGDLFFTRDHCDRLPAGQDCSGVTAHSTTDARDVPLGPAFEEVALDDPDRALLACDGKGLRSLPFDGGPARVLDEAPCGQLFREQFLGGPARVYYWTASSQGRRARLFVVPLDGSARPALAFENRGDEEVLAIGPPGAAYGHFAMPDFVNATDGWLGDWHFMERGRAVSYSRDFSRLRWLEHTAKVYPSGELFSAPVPGGARRRLARNVYQYGECPGGRVLAAANQAFEGPQNRIIAIDERRGLAQWVADGGAWYLRIPDSDNLLVQIPDGANDYALVRVAIPPPP